MFLSPFRRFASKPIRRRRDRSLRQRGRSGLTGWETLGLGMGDALCATESLEARAMMAADLAVVATPIVLCASDIARPGLIAIRTELVMSKDCSSVRRHGHGSRSALCAVFSEIGHALSCMG
ncbi:MAG: hypothetical protein ACKOEX_13510 [Planctomycetia bacterium]